MSNPEERQIVEDLDREVSRKGGLVALAACLAVAAAFAVTVVMDLLRTA